jgi:hypothetical protein
LCALGPPFTLARVPLAEINLLHSLLLLVAFSIAMAWTWTLFICFADLIRDHKLSGWGKALWVLALLVPIVGCLVYLAARGSGMQARAVARRREL